MSLEVLREEGIWDLIFSENFFYFGPVLGVLSEECCLYDAGYSPTNSTNSQIRSSGIEVLQMEVISFVEFAATSIGSVHNLVGTSVIFLISFIKHSTSFIYPCFILC